MKNEGEKKIAEIFGEVFKSKKLASEYYQQKIRKIWTEQMGPTIGGYTKQINVRKNKLYIHLDSAPLKQELSMSKDKIIAMINKELGEDFIKEIALQ